MKFKHTDLQKIFNLFLKKLDEFEEINLVDADMYWTISAPESYDITQQPDPIAGSLVDDVEQLLELGSLWIPGSL